MPRPGAGCRYELKLGEVLGIPLIRCRVGEYQFLSDGEQARDGGIHETISCCQHSSSILASELLLLFTHSMFDPLHPGVRLVRHIPRQRAPLIRNKSLHPDKDLFSLMVRRNALICDKSMR